VGLMIRGERPAEGFRLQGKNVRLTEHLGQREGFGGGAVGKKGTEGYVPPRKGEQWRQNAPSEYKKNRGNKEQVLKLRETERMKGKRSNGEKTRQDTILKSIGGNKQKEKKGPRGEKPREEEKTKEMKKDGIKKKQNN